MSQAALSKGMTLAEWAGLDEDTPGELVDGVLVEEEVPDAVHEAVVSFFQFALSNYFIPRAGWVFGSGLKIAVQSARGRMPDVSCYVSGRKPESRGPVTVPPDLAVEVVSPSPRDARRDRIEKPDEYARFGIRSYWIADPLLRSVEIWNLDAEGRYTRIAAATSGRLTDIPGFPSLSIDVDELWARVDQLEPANERY
jgi:Uma2 family endonuclease